MVITRARGLAFGMLVALAGCGGGALQPDRIDNGCERYAFAEDHSALAYLKDDSLIVRTAGTPPALTKLKKPECMVRAVEQLFLSPGGKTVAAYGSGEDPARPTCLLDVASGRTWKPEADGLLAWVGAEPVIIPDAKLPMPRAMCRAFATQDGPVVACLDEGPPGVSEPVVDGGSVIKVKRFRGRELAVWGDELAVPVHSAHLGDRKRMKIGWDGRMVTWVAEIVRVVVLTEREAKVRELAPDEMTGETPFGELLSVELEPNGRRLMLVNWQADDRFPQPLGHLRIIDEDGQVQRTIGAKGLLLDGRWEDTSAVWLVHPCGGARVPLPARDQDVITAPR